MIAAPCRIIHIDLSTGAPPMLALEPPAASLLVVFWWRDIPLGAGTLSGGELPVPASRVREIALRAIAPAIGEGILAHGFRAPLPVVGQRMPADEPADARALVAIADPLAEFVRRRNAPSAVPGVMTLIICTRDRPVELAHCLESVVATSPRFDQVLVVDNGPANPATREVVARFPGIEYIAEPRPGLSIARNTGLRASRGEIVAFTDDDVVVHPSWIARLRAAFADAATMAVTGLVLPAELETPAQVAFERDIGGFPQGFRPLTFGSEFYDRMRGSGVPVWRIGAGANMAFRREAFAAVGLFDERLGAGASGCSEDSEMWYRLLAAGHACRYEPTAVVFHRHRETWEGLRSQVRAYMRGHVIALFVQYRRSGDRGNLHRAFVTLPRYYLWLIWRGLRDGFGVRQRLMPAEVAGWLAGLRSLPRVRAAPAPVLEPRQRAGAAAAVAVPAERMQ